MMKPLETNNKSPNNKSPFSFLAPSWAELLEKEFSAPYMEALRQLLREEATQGHTVFPQKDKIFRALHEVDYPHARVVILGQDPYHGPGQANGLAFAVEEGVALPPSLQNIFQEIKRDCHTDKRPPSHLLTWAHQGVLLLNTVLTVRAHLAFSHRNKGWESFTDTVIGLLGRREKPLVFLLWGSAAQSKAPLISSHHVVLKAPHPSPLSAYRGFMGCSHFSKANEILKSWGEQPIDWARSS